MALGLGWALLMHQPFPGRGALRAMSLLPWVLPSTVCAFVWGWIFNSRFGVLNAVLMSLGVIEFPQAWLSTPASAMTAVVITKVWLSVPLYMAFFLAGLQTLDKEQLEAARVDGAGNWVLLRDHVMPHLKPVFSVVVVLGMIGNLQHFDTIYALTGGGPVRATTVLSIEVYRRAFEQLGHRPRLGRRRALGRRPSCRPPISICASCCGGPEPCSTCVPARTRRLHGGARHHRVLPVLPDLLARHLGAEDQWRALPDHPDAVAARVHLHAFLDGADARQLAEPTQEQPDRIHRRARR